ARRRGQGRTPDPAADLTEQRKLVDAFLAASRNGDFDGLLEVLDPDVVFRLDAGPGSPHARLPIEGAERVASEILSRGTPLAPLARPALVNGAAGVGAAPPGRPPAPGVSAPLARPRLPASA